MVASTTGDALLMPAVSFDASAGREQDGEAPCEGQPDELALGPAAQPAGPKRPSALHYLT